MHTSPKRMYSKFSINDFLESLSKLPLDDQLMISEIIHKRVKEEKRKELASSVKESKKSIYQKIQKKDQQKILLTILKRNDYTQLVLIL